MGGDWNCTVSSLPPLNNLDVLNMNSIPNKRHSEYLFNLCTTNNLTDPFRAKYPNRQEFSYVPSDPLKKNRSCIDFFIISNQLLNCVSDIYICPGLQSKVFIHKAVVLSFKPPVREGPIRPTISHAILRDPDLDLVVALAVADTYLASTTLRHDPDFIRTYNRLLTGVGQGFASLRRAGPNDIHINPGDRSEEESLAREGIIGNIREFLDNFPFARLRDGLFNIEDDLFLEGLMNNVRNQVISHQSFMLKTAKSKRKNLLDRIKNLQNDPLQNFDELTELENFLNKALDRELRHELEKLSGFEAVNSEKITPYFLSLAKSIKSEAKMSDIKNEEGNPFPNSDAMKKFVREYYLNLYKKDENEPVDFTNCIEEFLGNDICNNPITLSRKIPEVLKAQLERPISIDELDKSVAQANKSACGMDGLSNCFIKKYWHFFRTPLLRYLHAALDKESLTPTFRTGLIKLIPKKGDPTRLMNWRPISLLSCMYKVLSRALNNRLKLACNYIYSGSLKGFTSNRYIQEVLINLCETIGYCNSNNIPACIVAIDQSKAFDSISHKYMAEAYKFFGLGENFIRLLLTLGSGRNACISYDDGTVSPPFNLERGRTQGNGPSPCEYNIGQQILLLKIELCPEIASVFNHLQVPRTVCSRLNMPNPAILEAIRSENNPCFETESKCETNKAGGFADDTSVATIFNFDSLNALKTILLNFATFSGLKCNMEKTSIMQIGNIIPVPDQAI
jgi:hypothetical protein